jgi:hypothetical protein
MSDKGELNYYYHMVWNECNTDQDKLAVSYEASKISVVSGELDGSIHWIRTMLPLLRNDPGSNDKELGTFLSVLGTYLHCQTFNLILISKKKQIISLYFILKLFFKNMFYLFGVTIFNLAAAVERVYVLFYICYVVKKIILPFCQTLLRSGFPIIFGGPIKK